MFLRCDPEMLRPTWLNALSTSIAYARTFNASNPGTPIKAAPSSDDASHSNPSAPEVALAMQRVRNAASAMAAGVNPLENRHNTIGISTHFYLTFEVVKTSSRGDPPVQRILHLDVVRAQKRLRLFYNVNFNANLGFISSCRTAA